MISLRELSRENAFYFFASAGNYTGESASSLEEFARKIREITIESLEFHLRRGDFEKWMSGTLQDRVLAEEIKKLQNQNPSGDALREQLCFLVSKRMQKLKGGLPINRRCAVLNNLSISCVQNACLWVI